MVRQSHVRLHDGVGFSIGPSILRADACDMSYHNP